MPVMSRAPSSTRPEVGGDTPVSRLISVVLPAPLGPIRAWRAPRSTAIVTWSVAVMPPKRLTSAWVCSTTSLTSRPFEPPGPRPEQALAPHQHQHHQEQADPEGPVLRRDARQQVVHHAERQRADQRAPQPAGAADHHHQHHVGAAVELEHVERHEAGGLRQQRAGGTGQRGAQRVHRRQARLHRHADRRHAQPVVAQACSDVPSGECTMRRAIKKAMNSTASE